MIKKSTLIVLFCAAVLAGGVYYWTNKHASKGTETANSSKPAFKIKAEDITSITLSRPGNADSSAIQMVKENGAWKIVKPVETGADQASVNGIADGLAAALVSGTEPGTPDRLKAFGLVPGAISIEFEAKGGAKHRLLLGDKDFTGESVYGLADAGKTVDLLPQTLFVSADKSLMDLRDRSVLRVESESLSGFELKNASGEIAATKDSAGWMLTKPENKPADTDTVSQLVATVSTARMESVASETPENLGKYGLASPAITLETTDSKGNRQTLIVGKKDGDDYFARDLSRPMIFRINDDLYKKLSEKFDDFRDKTVLHFSADDINHIEVHNSSGTIVLNRKEAGKEDWTIEQPDSDKGKAAASWKVFSPIEGARADAVLDHAPAEALAGLAKPAIEVILTDKNGKKITFDVSKPVKDFAYARSSAGPAVFKVKKELYDDLNFTPAQALF
jgi:Domain of unknown function (DUF4340)